jgi:hypothetical protein
VQHRTPLILVLDYLRKGFMKGKLVFGIQNAHKGRSSSLVRHRPHAAKIAGSNPARPI